MNRILVVDDTLFDRRLVSGILNKLPRFDVTCVTDGREAIERIATEEFDLVVTDLNMPNLDGLTLVQRLNQEYPELPTVVMTAYGSEATAMRALQSGAYRYVPKFHLQDELAGIVSSVLAASRQKINEQRLLCSVMEHSLTLSLPNDRERITPTIEYIQNLMEGMQLFNGSHSVHLSVALEEALSNAIIHGNLEVSSELRLRDDNAYGELIEMRRTTAPWADRRVTIGMTLNCQAATFVIRDEGPGFDLRSIPDPLDPENLLKPSGRGITLMHAFLDEVRFNEKGNEVTLRLNTDRDQTDTESEQGATDISRQSAMV